MISVSPITGKKYKVALPADDREAINRFLADNKGKKIVVVQGLGFVGAVMTVVVANAFTKEYAVIGVDLPTENSYWKIASILDGDFPVVSSDKKVNELFEAAKAKSNIMATADEYAYSVADVVIVDINLDVEKNTAESKNSFNVDLSAFKKGIKIIGDNCKEDVLVLVETTVPPGTCQNVVNPILEECFEKRKLKKNYKLGHSYERVMPGPNYIDSVRNFFRVYAGINDESAIETEKFLKTIINTEEYPLSRLHSTTASETAKVLENSYRAMNIAFMHEWTGFAEKAGINLFEILNAIRMRPTHSNIMAPGLGVGGYCLPKDPLLASWASQTFFFGQKLPQSEEAVRINDNMPLHSFSAIMDAFNGDVKNKNILIFGVSYLADIGDTRYTPVQALYKSLKNANAKITLHDPYLRHWEEEDIPVENKLDAVLDKNYDAVIFATAHHEYRDNGNINKCLIDLKSVKVFDTNRVLTEKQIKLFKDKIFLKIIGRGDI